jgi:Zn-finger nucleic acid-binding protein
LSVAIRAASKFGSHGLTTLDDEEIMNCPNCKHAPLEATTLEPGLAAQRCITCAGIWLPSNNYREWRERQSGDLPELPEVSAELTVSDSSTAKTCPDCGHLLLPYRIGHGLTFALDHCGDCNGVWLDSNEWEALRGRNLHDNLHQMFAAPWQRRVRQEERRAALEQLNRARFGDQDYAELRRIKSWIDGHPEKDAMLGYISHPDPEDSLP